ncbi:MAG: CapA family protein [Lachnospiraceae bacterium]|nr:CapA family protein [Lachnospiraceae bacterium]
MKNKITYASINNKVVWESDSRYYVSDFLTGDVDHDGENELLLLFWKRGSFDKQLPFWISENDKAWSQHIAVYKWKEDYSYRLDPIWVTSKLGIDTAAFSIDEDGVVTLTDKDGEKTDWYWRSWGLVLLKEGERRAEVELTRSKREKQMREGETSSYQAEEKDEEGIVRIRFSAVGDNLIHEPIYRDALVGYEDKQQNGDSPGEKSLEDAQETEVEYDFSYVYRDVAEYFQGQDISWVNAETLINDEFPASSYPHFSTPGECGRALYDAGFRIFSLSNNHSYDQGEEGLSATEEFFAKMPEDCMTAGLFEKDALNRIPIYEYQGVKLAFLSYTYGTNGNELSESAEKRVILLSETELIKEQLARARQQADVVIVGCHFGKEGSFRVSDEQRTLAKALCEWGADLVIGTHPHVVQDAAWFRTSDGRKAFVCYSLGNFVSAMDKTGQLTGLVLSCVLECRPKKTAPEEKGEQETEQVEGYQTAIKEVSLIPIVTTYGPYYKRPHVRFLSDYPREEAAENRASFRDIDYSYDQIVKLLRENVSREFLDLSGISE